MWWLACAAPAPETPSAAPASDLRAHMLGHRADLGRIREAIARGDLPSAHAANEVFLDHPVSADLIGDWTVRVTAMGDASMALQAASDLPAAAAAAAGLAASCGECHRAVGVVPPYAPPVVPTDAGHAARQRAAIDRLFAALWTPAMGWDAATAAVIDATADPMVAGHGPYVEVVAAARGSERRHEAAGAVLAACAACHAPSAAGGVYPIAEAPAWAIAGGSAALVLGPREGSPRAAVQELRLEAGATVGPHAHPESDELIVVLAGRLEVTLDGRALVAGPDEVVHLPAGRDHAARAVTGVRALQIFVGPGPERALLGGTGP